MRFFLNFFIFLIFISNCLAAYPEYAGYVEHGDELGDLINLKGANLHIKNHQEKPGIYACQVDLPNLHMENKQALCCVEEPPSTLIEAHILDFNKDIYHQPIIIRLIQFLRKPKDFKTIEECSRTIENDKNKVRDLLP